MLTGTVTDFQGRKGNGFEEKKAGQNGRTEAMYESLLYEETAIYTKMIWIYWVAYKHCMFLAGSGLTPRT